MNNSQFNAAIQQLEADARLRNAAPELLVALQNIVARYHTYIIINGLGEGFADLAVEHARNAIAKATGEQS